ncbi:MAG: hypothetical protein WDM76_07380 [Limisphaerales bacterium]
MYDFLFPACFSQDLVSWNKVSDVLGAGENPYHATRVLNWPPLWMQLIFLFKKISLVTHLSFNTVVRGYLMATESMVALLLYFALFRFTETRSAAKLLFFGIAINPIAIFQICQHCNFDVLVGFWILLAVYMLLRFQERHEPQFWLFACFALGMGALTKTVPLSLAPLLLLSIRKVKRSERFLGLAFLMIPVTLALSIVYVLTPSDIETKVLGYRSTLGGFGFTGLFMSFGAQYWADIWPRVFEVVYGIGWLSLSVWLLSKDTLDKRKIVLIAVNLLLAIVVLGPGKGLQYVYWFLPLLVLLYGLAEHKTRVFLWLLYVVASVSYTIEYALNYNIYGAFLLDGPFSLDFAQVQALIKLGLKLASNEWETILLLPLWIIYFVFLVLSCRMIGREIIADLKTFRQRN